MNACPQDLHYPGSTATPADVLQFADRYRNAALTLLASPVAGDPLARAPAQFCAAHSIEAYLNAFLLSRGHTPAELRAMHHDLAQRADAAHVRGLVLRNKTQAHLQQMTARREYLVVRYDPEMTRGLATHPSRLVATLTELSTKVRPHVPAAAQAI